MASASDKPARASALLPYPILSAVLLGTWLLLNNSIAPGHILLGAVLAWVLPLLTRRFLPERTEMRGAGAALRLIGRVLLDILVANIAVARAILGPVDQLQPRFVIMSTPLRNPLALTALANIISLTPGTVTTDVDEEHGRLLIHALNVRDEQAMVDHIRRYYEAPLKEIFPC